MQMIAAKFLLSKALKGLLMGRWLGPVEVQLYKPNMCGQTDSWVGPRELMGFHLDLHIH